MHPLLIAQLLALLAVANGTPIIVEKFLGKFLAFPVDGGATLADGKPLFGSSKTLRGLALSIFATTAFAPLIGLDWRIGALVAATAMLGDLLSSFLKRRMRAARAETPAQERAYSSLLINHVPTFCSRPRRFVANLMRLIINALSSAMCAGDRRGLEAP